MNEGSFHKTVPNFQREVCKIVETFISIPSLLWRGKGAIITVSNEQQKIKHVSVCMSQDTSLVIFMHLTGVY